DAEPPLERGEQLDAVHRVEPEIQLQARVGPYDNARPEDRLSRRDEALQVRFELVHGVRRDLVPGGPGRRLVTVEDLVPFQIPCCRASKRVQPYVEAIHTRVGGQ